MEPTKWISIESDQFPADNQEVLVCAGEKALMAIYRCADDEKVGGYEWEVQKYTCEGERVFVTYWTGITHWMPLPEPPKN